jgi:hypothetical protein
VGDVFLVDISPRNSGLKLKRLRRDGTAVDASSLLLSCVSNRTKPRLPLTASRDQLLTGSWRYAADHPDTNVRRPLSHYPGSGAFFRKRPRPYGRRVACKTPNAPIVRPEVPLWVNRRIVSRRSSLMPGDHSSWQGSDTINALPCGALIPNGADGWRHCFERAKNGQIGADRP